MAENKIPLTYKNQSATFVHHTNNANAIDLKEIKNKVTTLFFDFDNTLIPTRSGDQKACRKCVLLCDVLEVQFGFTKDEATSSAQTFLKSFRRCPDNSQTSLDSWRTYLWRESLPKRHKHLAEQIYTKWLQYRYRYLAISADNVQMLKRFRRAGYLLALITNGPSNAQWEKIKKLNVSQYFDCILVSSDLPWEKPNPNIFYAACNFLGVKPAECAMIGDKLESDIKGGCLANLGATFWIPLNPAEIDLSDVIHPPNVILKGALLDLRKYFPTINVATGSNTSQSTTLSFGSSGGVATIGTSTSAQCRRRGSQFSCSTTMSTCDSDFHRHHPFQHHQHSQSYNNKYRRGNSLPIENFNSEAENSLDSLFG